MRHLARALVSLHQSGLGMSLAMLEFKSTQFLCCTHHWDIRAPFRSTVRNVAIIVIYGSFLSLQWKCPPGGSLPLFLGSSEHVA